MVLGVGLKLWSYSPIVIGMGGQFMNAFYFIPNESETYSSLTIFFLIKF